MSGSIFQDVAPPAFWPTVLCVMLVDGRREMVRRALKSFYAQHYQRKRLLIWDTGEEPLTLPLPLMASPLLSSMVWAHWMRGDSIGNLRNAANKHGLTHPPEMADEVPDVIAHWDSDDWSHPHRLSQQVAHLVGSWPHPCVGYNDMIFWDSREQISGFLGAPVEGPVNEAWRYQGKTASQPLGTSLMYWADAWLHNHFQDFHPSTGAEDVRFLDSLQPKAVSVSSIADLVRFLDSRQPKAVSGLSIADLCPLPYMIASIHGANTSTRIVECPEWTRVPQYDAICRKTMAL